MTPPWVVGVLGCLQPVGHPRHPEPDNQTGPSMRNKFLDLIGRNHPGTRSVLQPPVSELTWTCHVCGDERRDRFIGVFTREKMWPGGVRFRENIRFCNDRLECTQGANDVHFVKDEHADNDFGRVQVHRDGS